MQKLKTKELEVRIDDQRLTVGVKDLRTGLEWRMQEEGPGDIGIKGHCGPWTGLNFRQAGKVVWSGEGNRRKAAASLWPVTANVWSPCDHVVEVEYELSGEELDITLRVINGRGETSVIDSYYPRGFLFPKGVGGDLVLPIGQGCLLRKDFPCELNHTLPNYVGPGFVMPWWGHLADSGEGILAVTETPDDIAFRVVTEGGGGGHTCHPYWQASLGNFRYARRIRYRFYPKVGLVELAKAYRQHAQKHGLAVTLKEKARQRPNVDKLRGGLIMSIWHMSDFAELAIGDRRKHILTFDDGLRRYLRLVQLADLKKVFLHVDGWCRGGYDYYHPDILPPDPLIGGWAGLERMAHAVQALGHGFMLHDQYADIYATTESFTPENTVLDLSGVRPENCEWLGGRQQWICPQRTKMFVERNQSQSRDRLKPSGVFLDCHTVGHLRECYDQRHLSSRADTRRIWSETFQMCQDWGWVTGSEGGADWAIPVLDYGENIPAGVCPFDLKGKLNGPLGDPIPLYNLVWHDCLFNQAGVDRRKSSDLELWLMLWGGLPAYRPAILDNIPGSESQPTDDEYRQEAEFIKALKPAMELNGRVAYEQIVNLEFPAEGRKVQRTTFGDGTRVTVDFERKTYQVDWAEGGQPMTGGLLKRD